MRYLLLTALPLLAAGCSSVSTSSAADEAAKPGAAERAIPTRPGSDWPRILGPQADGSSTEKGILTAWPKEGLKKVWECDLGEGYAPPVTAGGKLFHFDRFADNCRVTCRNAETGEFLWKYEYPTEYRDQYGYEPGPRACPVADGDRVYAYGPDGILVCLDAEKGKELWKVDTKEKFHFHQNFFGVGSAPLVHGDLLIVAVGGSPKGPKPFDLRDAKGNGSAIVAFDKKTGEQKYAFGDELASYSCPTLAKLGDKTVGLYFARGGLVGFDPVAGKQLFHHKWRAKILESVNAANPVMVGDKIFLTECYGPGGVCLQVKENKLDEVWSDSDKDRDERSLACHWCTPIHDKGVLYGSSGRHADEAQLRCVDLATGDVKWKEKRLTRCTLTKIDGHLLCLGENGELRLVKLNPEKFEVISKWEVPDLEYPAWAPPVVSRGLLYLRGKGKLVCYELIPKK